MTKIRNLSSKITTQYSRITYPMTCPTNSLEVFPFRCFVDITLIFALELRIEISSFSNEIFMNFFSKLTHTFRADHQVIIGKEKEKNQPRNVIPHIA